MSLMMRIDSKTYKAHLSLFHDKKTIQKARPF